MMKNKVTSRSPQLPLRLGAIVLSTGVLLGAVVWLSACATSHSPDQPNPDAPPISIYDIPSDELMAMSDRELLERVGALAKDNLSSFEQVANNTGYARFFPNAQALLQKQKRILAERDRLVSNYQQSNAALRQAQRLASDLARENTLTLGGESQVGNSISREAFEKEFFAHVSYPCASALFKKAGVGDLNPKNIDPHVFKRAFTEAYEIVIYRFDHDQLQTFQHYLRDSKTDLYRSVAEKPHGVRIAWYDVTVKRCLELLPE